MIEHATEMEKNILMSIDEQINDRDAWEIYNYHGIESMSDREYQKVLYGFKKLYIALRDYAA